MSSTDRILLCPKCGKEMVKHLAYLTLQVCPEWFKINDKCRTAYGQDQHDLQYKWMIDDVEYTDEEVERYRKLRVFI